MYETDRENKNLLNIFLLKIQENNDLIFHYFVADLFSRKR